MAPTAGAAGAASPPAGRPDGATAMLIPVGRTPLSIIAGYAGLFSFLMIPGPIALVLGILALRELKHKPEAMGRGRAWFAVVAGGLATLLLLAAVLGALK